MMHRPVGIAVVNDYVLHGAPGRRSSRVAR